MASRHHTYAKNEATTWPVPNYWDLLALVLVLAVITLLGFGAKAMLGHYQLGQVLPISISPSHLPYYALRTLLRMLVALICSLLFTFVFGTWAAKSRRAERIIIPLIDILQSVPVLGYLSITLVAFVVLFRGSLLGPECAAIFTIFTAQVWNMTLSFYQSVANVPEELNEAAKMFHLNAWQKFWRIEVPFAMPGLIWNMMMSMSGSWVFLVASEAMSVANQNITLPGIGSYIDLAIRQQNVPAMWWVTLAVFLVIVIYDQLMFRPLVAWSEKFTAEDAADEVVPQSWVLDLFQRARFLAYIGSGLSVFSNWFLNLNLLPQRPQRQRVQVKPWLAKAMSLIWGAVLTAMLLYAVYVLYHFIFNVISYDLALHVVYLGLVTMARILVVIVVSSLIWVPIGVWIGARPRVTAVVQPIAQFLAAFPINLLFPVAAILILKYDLNVNVWCSPLMVLGTQWYILFNVIAGSAALPKNLRYAVDTLNVTGWLKWRQFLLPGIFPYFITGAITAAGGAWNITIIAEAIQWGNQHLDAVGIGAYITHVSDKGDFPQLALGIAVMCILVLIVNRVLWRPLYNLAQERFQIR